MDFLGTSHSQNNTLHKLINLGKKITFDFITFLKWDVKAQWLTTETIIDTYYKTYLTWILSPNFNSNISSVKNISIQ